jgi:hypothetical protein
VTPEGLLAVERSVGIANRSRAWPPGDNSSARRRRGQANKQSKFGPENLSDSETTDYQSQIISHAARYFSPITSHGRASGLAVRFQNLFLAFSPGASPLTFGISSSSFNPRPRIGWWIERIRTDT